MGLSKISSTDPIRNVLISILTLQQSDGTPVNPVTSALVVQASFPLVGQPPTVWRTADWVTVNDGTFRARCAVGTGATGILAPGRYQPYIRVVLGTETITTQAADVLESY